MSFWDRYLAPGDVRAQQQRNAVPSPPPRDIPAQEIERPPRIDAAHRQRRQDALLYGGVLFTCLSLFITRRSLGRKHLPTPGSFTPSNAPPPKSDGALDGAEALGLATLNVFSIAMLAAGGFMKVYDIADVEDLRDAVRKGAGFDVYGGNAEADKEMEGWIADVLSRKDGGGDLKEGIALKLQELAEMEKKKENDGKR